VSNTQMLTSAFYRGFSFFLGLESCAATGMCQRMHRWSVHIMFYLIYWSLFGDLLLPSFLQWFSFSATHRCLRRPLPDGRAPFLRTRLLHPGLLSAGKYRAASLSFSDPRGSRNPNSSGCRSVGVLSGPVQASSGSFPRASLFPLWPLLMFISSAPRVLPYRLNNLYILRLISMSTSLTRDGLVQWNARTQFLSEATTAVPRPSETLQTCPSPSSRTTGTVGGPT
jgi:hypothetical protein